MLEEEPGLETHPELLAVLVELQAREPIFHRPEAGTRPADLGWQMAPGFWEGAPADAATTAGER